MGTSGRPTSVWQPPLTAAVGMLLDTWGRPTSWKDDIDEKPLSSSALLTLVAGFGLDVTEVLEFPSACNEYMYEFLY